MTPDVFADGGEHVEPGAFVEGQADPAERPCGPSAEPWEGRVEVGPGNAVGQQAEEGEEAAGVIGAVGALERQP